MPLVDFHCHLTESGGYPALPADEGSLFDAPVPVVAVTNRPSDWRAMVRGVGQRPVVWALGMHPELPHSADDVRRFLDAVPACEAIGEVGLDYSTHARAERADQRRTLNAVLSATGAASRLVSLHSRGAVDDVIASLSDHPVPGAILHWFLGTAAQIAAAIDLDVFFSVNQAMLSNERGKGVVAGLPPNRIVLETDSPYGGPPKQTATPGHLARTVVGLSKIWGRDLKATTTLIEANQRNLLGRVQVPAALQAAVSATA